MANTDNIAAMALAVRAAALRCLGHEQAALDVTKEALRYPSRAPAAGHRARFERGRAFADLGQLAKGRAEFERILTEDSTYPGVTAILGDLAARS